MKVTLLNDSFPPVIDGVANVVLNYADICVKDNLAEVMVCTPEYPGTDYSVYPYRVVPYKSFDTTKIVKGYRAGNPLDLKELKHMVDYRPDIIHTHCPVASTYVSRMIRSMVDAPIVFTYHTKFDEDIAKAVKMEFLRKETSKVLVNNIEACDEVWVVSEGAGENMRSLGYQGDYRVMNNGVDFEKGRVDADTVAKVTAGYDLPAGVPVFLFVGRIIEYKGIPVILDAMSILKEAGIDFRMVFVGSGPDFEKYTSLAEEKGLGAQSEHGKCIFTGPIYDRNVLRAWNTRSDVFIFPSTYDTNGIVVREAAACGLASVLIKGSCAAEGITDGRNGYLVEKTASDIAELLKNITTDLDRVHEVGQHAMDEIYISWRDSVHAAHERYGELIELQKRGILMLNRTHKVPEMFETMSDDIALALHYLIEKPYHSFDNMLNNVEDAAENMYDEMEEYLRKKYDRFKTSVHRANQELSDFFKDIK